MSIVKFFKRTFGLFIFLALMFLLHIETRAQMQLLLLKHERILLRLYPGDDFVYRLKGSRTVKSSYVNNLSETEVFTHQDTVPFHTIDRIYFRHSTFMNRLGSRLFAGGIVLLVIDQGNELIQGHSLNLDRGVSTVCLALAGAGLPMMLIRKRAQRLNYKYKLMMVEKGSVFYKEDRKGFQSPYLPN